MKIYVLMLLFWTFLVCIDLTLFRFYVVYDAKANP